MARSTRLCCRSDPRDVLRASFLYLSRRRGLQRLVTRGRITSSLAYRFVAGDRLDDAVRVVAEVNRRGWSASLDHLGENVTEEKAARSAADDYLAAFERIAAEKLDASVIAQRRVPGDRDPRRPLDRGDQTLRARARDHPGPLRVPDAVWDSARFARPAAARRLPRPNLRALWDGVVSIPDAPPGGATGQLTLYRPQPDPGAPRRLTRGARALRPGSQTPPWPAVAEALDARRCRQTTSGSQTRPHGTRSSASRRCSGNARTSG